MPIFTDISVVKYEDLTIPVTLSPPVAVGGLDLRFSVLRHFDGVSGIVEKFVSSGYNNTSGINITNSGQGIMSIRVRSQDTSGIDPGSYAWVLESLSSGVRTSLAQGFFVVGPPGRA